MMLPPEQLWWTRIGKSLRVLDSIKQYLQQESSFLLLSPQGLPWEATFLEKFRETAAGLDFQRSARVIRPGKAEPGRYCLEELCPEAVRIDYWYTDTPAQFLCRKGEIPMHRYYILVQDLTEEEDLLAWQSFCLDYEKEARERSLASKAVFILEYLPGPERASRGFKTPPLLPVLTYQISENDCRVFCMEDASEEEALSEYLLELTIQLAGDSPEACHALLSDPTSLLENPQGRMRDLHLATEKDPVDRQVWKAQVRHFFPLLEEYRQAFIRSHREILRRSLPIKNGYGGTISDPEDLEFGHLLYLLQPITQGIERSDKENLAIAKAARNSLAHLSTLTYPETQRLARMLNP